MKTQLILFLLTCVSVLAQTHARIEPPNRAFNGWITLSPDAIYDQARVAPCVIDPVPDHDPATQLVVEIAPFDDGVAFHRRFGIIAKKQEAVDRVALINETINDLQTALANWDALTAAQQKAALKRVTKVVVLLLKEERIDLRLAE